MTKILRIDRIFYSLLCTCLLLATLCAWLILDNSRLRRQNNKQEQEIQMLYQRLTP